MLIPRILWEIWMTVWEKTNLTLLKIIWKEEKAWIVHCKDDGNDNKGYCEVETSAYTQGKEVTLLEKEEFYKYVIKEEKGTFKLDLQSAVDIVRLSVDIMIFTGDVTFDIRNQDLSSYNDYKYYLSNKIHYHYSINKKAFETITLEYQAQIIAKIDILINIWIQGIMVV